MKAYIKLEISAEELEEFKKDYALYNDKELTDDMIKSYYIDIFYADHMDFIDTDNITVHFTSKEN